MFEVVDGAEAVQHIRAQPEDLIITDILMPEMQGAMFYLSTLLNTSPSFTRVFKV